MSTGGNVLLLLEYWLCVTGAMILATYRNDNLIIQFSNWFVN